MTPRNIDANDLSEMLTPDDWRAVFSAMGFKLGTREPNGDGWLAGLLLPPGFGDENASCSVNLRSGHVLDFGGRFEGSGYKLVQEVKGCDFPEAVATVAEITGRIPATTPRPTPQPKRQPTPPQTAPKPRQLPKPRDGYVEDGFTFYIYRDDNGGLARRKQRPGRGGSKAEWAGKKNSEPGLYCLPDLREAINDGRTVYVVEGEKDTDTLYLLGLTATTSGGADTWRSDLARYFEGADVVILPDNDEAGRKYARAVYRDLEPVARRVAVVDLPGLPEKGDVSDWLKDGDTAAELLAVVNDSDPPAWLEDSDATEGDTTAATTTTDEAAATGDATPPEAVAGVLLSKVERKPIRWLWPGFLPEGKLVILDGDPGVGKSTLVADLAARLTTGRQWPDGSPGCDPGSVLYLTVEDDVADTIAPRFAAAGADLDRVVHVATTEGLRVPDLQHDGGALFDRLRSMPAGPRLLVIDPLMAHLGDANSYRDQDIRAVLGPVAEAAAREGVTVLVIRHLTKAPGGSALYRGGGTIGIIGAARVGLFVGFDPEDESKERRILAVSKSNLARRGGAFAFELATDAENPDVAAVAWQGPVTTTADDLVAVPSRDEDGGPAVQAAAEWLEDLLSLGPLPAAEGFERAEAEGIAEKTIRRALKRPGFRSTRKGFGKSGRWQWELVTQAETPKAANGATSPVPLAIYGKFAEKRIDGQPYGEGETVGHLWGNTQTEHTR